MRFVLKHTETGTRVTSNLLLLIEQTLWHVLVSPPVNCRSSRLDSLEPEFVAFPLENHLLLTVILRLCYSYTKQLTAEQPRGRRTRQEQNGEYVMTPVLHQSRFLMGSSWFCMELWDFPVILTFAHDPLSPNLAAC